MENKSLVSLSIGDEVIKPIVEEHLKNALLSALGGRDEIIKSVLNAILYQKVNKDGIVSIHDYENKYTWFDIILTKQIKEYIHIELEKHLEELSTPIKNEFVKSIKSQKGATMVAEALLDGFKDALKSKWRTYINIDFKKMSDEE